MIHTCAATSGSNFNKLRRMHRKDYAHVEVRCHASVGVASVIGIVSIAYSGWHRFDQVSYRAHSCLQGKIFESYQYDINISTYIQIGICNRIWVKANRYLLSPMLSTLDRGPTLTMRFKTHTIEVTMRGTFHYNSRFTLGVYSLFDSSIRLVYGIHACLSGR